MARNPTDIARDVADEMIGNCGFSQGLGMRIANAGPDFAVIEMTLTAPGCPVAGDMPGWVETAARGVDGVKDVEVRLTFDPPWDPSRMSDEARLALNML